MPDSPFELPAISRGYPLDEEEESALEQARREIEEERQGAEGEQSEQEEENGDG